MGSSYLGIVSIVNSCPSLITPLLKKLKLNSSEISTISSEIVVEFILFLLATFSIGKPLANIPLLYIISSSF